MSYMKLSINITEEDSFPISVLAGISVGIVIGMSILKVMNYFGFYAYSAILLGEILIHLFLLFSLLIMTAYLIVRFRMRLLVAFLSWGIILACIFSISEMVTYLISVHNWDGGALAFATVIPAIFITAMISKNMAFGLMVSFLFSISIWMISM